MCKSEKVCVIALLLTPSSPSERFRTGIIANFFGLVDHQLACISVLCSKKQNLFITYVYTTHFRSFQISKALIFQYKSLYCCCHTLLR
jgi:hypothetical protein